MTETRTFDFRPIGPRIVVTIDYTRLGARLAGKMNRTNHRTGLKPAASQMFGGAIRAKVTDR